MKKSAQRTVTKAKLQYGFVQVIGGRYKGKVGYFDDDTDDSKSAIVYLETPFLADYVIIAKRLLKQTKITPVSAARFKRDHPALVKKFGIAI